MAKKILIVDDEPDIIEILRFRLEKKGYRVVAAFDGEEALDQVEKEQPDLIVLDLMMPKMDGAEVCRRLKRNPAYQEIPIIMLTAKARDVDKMEGISLGADDYIVKPYDAQVLFKSMEEILKLRE